MKRTIELRFRENNDSGEIGLEPKGASETYEPLSNGFGLAHDILEHLNGFDSVSDEIIAHGVMYWLRYESGFCPPPYHNPLTIPNIGSEWNNLFDAMENDGHLSICNPQKPLDETREAELASIIESGKKYVRDERYNDDEENSLYNLEILSERFADWFRLGVRLAEKRYGKAGRDATCDMFSEIIRYMDTLFKREELESAQACNDGVRVIVDTCKATVRFQRFGECGHCGCSMKHKDETYDICKDCSLQLA